MFYSGCNVIFGVCVIGYNVCMSIFLKLFGIFLNATKINSLQ